MNERDLIATQTIKQVSEGGDAVRADLKATAAAQDALATSSTNLGTATETSARRQTSAAAAWEALQRKADPATRANAEFEKSQQIVNRALDQGITSQGRANEILDVYVQKANAAAAAAENLRKQQSAESATPVRAQDAINKSLGIGAVATPTSARASASAFFSEADIKANDDMTSSITRLRTAINPLQVEQGKLGVEMANYRTLLQQGKITNTEYASAQEIAGKRLGDFAQNLKTAGTAGRVMSGEMTNLGYQLNDIVTGLALGQSPFMILAQQGGQVTQIFTNSKASIADFATSAMGWISGLITPARLAIGVLAGFATIGLSASASWASGQHDIEKSLVGIGRQSGITANEINSIGESAGRTTKLSIGDATQLAASYAKIGGVAKESIGPAVMATDGLAKALGVDAAEAAGLLGNALANPARGLDELQAKTGAFNVQSREMIATAVRNGDLWTAQALITNRVVVATQGAIKANESWTDSFKDLWKWTKDTGNAIGQMVVTGAQLVRHDTGGPAASLGFSRQQQIDTTQSDIGKLVQRGPATPVGGGNADLDTDAIKAYNAELAILTDRAQKLKQEKLGSEIASWNAQLDNVAASAKSATDSFVPQIEKIKEVEAAVLALRRAKMLDLNFTPASQQALTAGENTSAALKDSQADAARYNDRVKEITANVRSWGAAYSGVSQSATQVLQASQNQLPVIQAVTEQQKMAAQYAADYANALNRGARPADALVLASDNLTKSQAAATANVERQILSLKDSTSMIKAQQNGTEAVTEAAIAYRNAIRSGADETSAAALKTETLRNAVARGAAAALEWQQNMLGVGAAAQQAAASAQSAADAFQKTANAATPGSKPSANGDFGSQGFTENFSTDGKQYTSTGSASFKAGGGGGFRTGPFGGIDLATMKAPSVADQNTSIANSYIGRGDYSGAISGVERLGSSADVNLLDTLTQQKNAMTSDIGSQVSNIQDLISFIQHQPESLAGDQKIVSLQQSIDQLKQSTDQNTKTITDTFKPGQQMTIINVAPGVTADQFIQSRTQIQRAVGGG